MHTFIETLSLKNNGVPIYVQLRDQALRALDAGILRPGEQMPTMREVAVALKIDLNTVRHAYDELERSGAITLARGRGSFVAERPAAATDARTEEPADGLARQAIAMAAAIGVDPLLLADRITALALDKEQKQ
jgi:GntR family transcriptional regulator